MNKTFHNQSNEMENEMKPNDNANQCNIVTASGTYSLTSAMSGQFMPPANVLANLVSGYHHYDEIAERWLHTTATEIIEQYNDHTIQYLTIAFDELNETEILYMYCTVQCIGNAAHEYKYLTDLFFTMMELAN